ncbi:metallopeptidase MepB [Aureobasidium sp. EXF-12298]|nr:metallopeptidase MepB [Aureobasidium sp. EXF-12298]KAI4753889.1 metallopeptidase MepB [Aureobasidium sp. EXF-12344]KAI4777755.1 metallopeptidase MepB [Aureobasidium sp. EXF-3400]
MSRSKTRTPPQKPPVFTTDASTIIPEVERLIKQSRKVQETILATINPETAVFSNVILPLARNQDSVSRQLPILSFYEAVSPDESLQDASTEAKKLYADFEIETNTHEGMFELVDAVVKKNKDLEAEDKRLLERYQRNFLRNGLGVTTEKRERFKEIQKQLHQLASDFEKNLRDGNKGVWFELEELAGLPSDLASSLTRGTGEHDGKVLLPFGFPHVSTVLKYATNSETRRVYYTAYDNRCPKNISAFKEIMVLRQESAQLLGYANHAAFRIEDKMAKTPDAVMGFLDDLHSRLSARVKAEVDELKILKSQDLEARGEVSDGKMYLWDQPFYNRMMLEKESSIDRQQVAEFFPLETTVTGVLGIFSHLFGLVFEEIVGEDKDALSSTGQGGDLVWQEDVQMYAVWDDEKEGGAFVGYLYLDLYPRSGKYGGMCNMNLQCGFEQEDGLRHYPATALICNLSKPTITKPSLLTHDQVLLFFHELGHGIHDLVARTKYSAFHGTATVDDFCEAPSQMLEFWCWIPELLQSLSNHYTHLSPSYLETWKQENPDVEAQPEKHIPLTTIEKLVTAKNVNGSLFQSRLLHRSYFDMIVHQPSSVQEIQDMDIGEQWNKLQGQISFLDTGDDYNGLGYSSFNAVIRVYDAGFYGYLYSRVYAADMFYSVFKDDPMNAIQGRRYRRMMLEKGASVDEMTTLVEFLEREPSAEAFYKDMGLQ